MANENFLKDLSPKNLLFYARQPGMVGDATLAQASALAEELFPTKTTLALDYEYWIGQNMRPIMATLTPFDVEAPLAGRQGISGAVRGELPKIQRKIRLQEKERLLLLRIMQNAALPAEIKQYIMDRYNDVDAMRDAVEARKVYLIFQALTTLGDITFSEGGISLTVNFGVPTGQQETLTTPWSNAASTPLDDIRRWKEKVEDDRGITPTRALTSGKAVRYLLQNDAVREIFIGRNFSGQKIRMVPSINDLNNYMQEQGLPEIQAFDGKILVEDAAGARTLTRFFPEDKFVLLPEGPLGNALVGPTAEALGMVEQGIIDSTEAPGLWVGVTKESDPPVQYTKAAMVTFPTFPQADRIFQADVL
jgi:hypothetical protein